ncbi:membrane protein [Lysinibacillus contaminans]|uniref:Membrane protein n=1 Tax=Lysinibacillus contaminans TaxID=1293441 RepID=A0ABR5K2G9_9BACI|nr:hypothetical protein [Lysinibacillus contaminans]KOS68963.1 membrane protein [Lysinibacillus contaminans]
MNYDTSYSEYDAGLSILLIIAILVVLVLAIIGYVISALIYYKTSKTNGFSDAAYIAWIPLLNVYSLFLLTASGDDDTTVRAAAKKNTLIYFGLIIVSFIPIIGIIGTLGGTGFVLYYAYRLQYRWSGETGKAVLYVILTIITGGLFFAIYGLMRMNRPFKA